MMKIRKILAAVLLICVLTPALAACGKTLSGRYVIADLTDDPEGTTFAELDEMYKEEDQTITDYLYMEFQSGGGFTLVLFGEEEAKGTYAKSGKTLTLTSGGISADATVKGDKITYTYETGAKLIFQKVPSGLSTGAIVGIAAGSAVALGVAGFCVYWFAIRKKTAAKK